MKEPGRCLDEGAEVHSAAVSKKREAASSTIQLAIGLELTKGKFVCKICIKQIYF